MGTCPRCQHDHPPVSFTAWAWAVRDAKDKPPAGQVAVLLILGTRMNPRTGCGWISRERLMADLGVKKETVTRATIWAMNNLLLDRLVRGHRTWDGGATDSLWTLADPTRAQTGAVEDDHTTAQTGAVEDDSTAQTGAVERSHNSARLPHTRAQMGAPKEEPVEVKPVEDLTAAPAQPHDSQQNTQALVAEWLDHCAARPPGRVIGQISKHLKNLLEGDQIAYEHVRAGLALWHQKGDQHPATLDSFVNAAMNGTRRPGTNRESGVNQVAQAREKFTAARRTRQRQLTEEENP